MPRAESAAVDGDRHAGVVQGVKQAGAECPGEGKGAELYWYEATGIGRKELKIKQLLSEP